MKANCFIALLIVMISFSNLQSQQFLQEGNQWTYITLDHITGNLAKTYFKIQGDTTINNINYKKSYTRS